VLGDVWDKSVLESTIPALQVMTRTNVIGGENSWTVSLNPAAPPASPGNSIWIWRAEEWANIDYLPVVSTASAADLSPTASPFSTGSTSSFTGEPFVGGVRGDQLLQGGRGQPAVADDHRLDQRVRPR
jgi:hypothetical protein